MLTLRYNEPVFILMLRGRVGCLRQPTLPQEAGVMSLHFTSESAETQYMYVLGNNFSDTAYYLHDFMPPF